MTFELWTQLLCCRAKPAKAINFNFAETGSFFQEAPEQTPEISSTDLDGKDQIKFVSGDKAKISSMCADEADESVVVKDLEQLAAKIARWIQKYPKSKSRFLRRPNDRFMALLPAEEGYSELHRWRQGFLVYWESKDAYLSHGKPKGYLNLLQITKVRHVDAEHDGRGVLVKEVQEGRSNEMMLLLPNRNEARQFSYMLWEFLAKLRDQWNDENQMSCIGA